MTPLEREKFRLWSAIEYLAGYEFPEWRDGKWKSVAQYKLTFFRKEQ